MTTVDTRGEIPLSPKEMKAVELAAQGLRHEEIAKALGNSARRVYALLRESRLKRHAKTTIELIHKLTKEGFIGN